MKRQFAPTIESVTLKNGDIIRFGAGNIVFENGKATRFTSYDNIIEINISDVQSVKDLIDGQTYFLEDYLLGEFDTFLEPWKEKEDENFDK